MPGVRGDNSLAFPTHAHVLICTHVTTTYFCMMILKWMGGWMVGEEGTGRSLCLDKIRSCLLQYFLPRLLCFVSVGFPTQNSGLAPFAVPEDFPCARRCTIMRQRREMRKGAGKGEGHVPSADPSLREAHLRKGGARKWRSRKRVPLNRLMPT